MMPAVSWNLAEIADEIGFAPAIILAGAYGGVNIYVPSTMHSTHALARLFSAHGLGVSPAFSLSQLYPDSTLAVPKLYAYDRLRQCAEAVLLHREAMDEKRAAQQMGISLKTYRKRLCEAQSIGLRPRKKRKTRGMAAIAVSFSQLVTRHGELGEAEEPAIG